MKSTPFDPANDLPPIPFTDQLLQAAKGMKEKGLKWQPHVGCFVWDDQQMIEVPSPFPNRVYFILNLGHFLKRFETIENIADKLVWLPTWHQARQICHRLNIPYAKILHVIQSSNPAEPGTELIGLYRQISEAL